jgi:hypothetical protein
MSGTAPGTEPIDMPLAAIVGIWVLLATPSTGGALGVSVSAAQGASSTQDSQTTPAPKQETPPNSESKPAPTPSTEPAPQENPPQAGAPQEPAKPGQQAQPSQTETPPASPPSSGQQPENAQPGSNPEQPKTPEPQTEPPKTETKSTSKTAAPKTSASKTSASRTRKRRKRKSAAHSDGATAPTKTVVRNGSTGEPSVQLSPGLSQQQASSQRQNTSQLLASTDANLKKVAARQLSASQEDTANQIRQYMQQANAAVAAGDLERGHNLAVKAQLLSEELVKQ